MQSKKRFTETNVWDHNWFSNLNQKQKLLWFYINDKCNNIGVWEPNLKLAAYHIGFENPEKFAQAFFDSINKDEERIIIIEKQQWFITNFVKFQFVKDKPLNPNNAAHKSYLRQISQSGLREWFVNNQPEVLFHADHIESSRRAFIDPSKSYKEMDKDYEKEEKMEKELELYKVRDKKNEKVKSLQSDFDPFEDITGFKPIVVTLTRMNRYLNPNDKNEIINDLEMCEATFDKFIDLGWGEKPLSIVMKNYIKISGAGSFEDILRNFEEKNRNEEVIAEEDFKIAYNRR